MARVVLVVSPGAARSEIVRRHGGAWKVRVAAPPERGRANEDVAVLLAAVARVPRAAVRLAAGATGRQKVVEVDGLTDAELEHRLAAAATR